MKSVFTTFLFLFSLIFTSIIFAQDFDGTWQTDYATTDDDANGTGYNTISVGVVKENTFVALVNRSSSPAYYLVGYTNADSTNGRMGTYEYTPAYQQPWISGFDQIEMKEANDLAVTPDSLIYVVSNDAERNILVFRMSSDSVISTDYRMITGADSIWAIDVDANGIVYVSSIKDSGTVNEVLVFNSIKNDGQWLATSHSSAPMTTITLPEPGDVRGIAVNPEGTLVYISNFNNDKVYCYVGDPQNGYTLYNGFSFTLTDAPIAADSSTLNPGPWGMKFMKDKNILFVACDVNFKTGIGYEYGRIYLLNPNTGAILDTIDAAAWNFKQTGAYNSRSGGTVGNVSGYTSTYNVAFDENYNVYDQSYYGWTVDKWSYSKDLPVIPLTITGIEREDNVVPDKFTLEQNYPNPFNPSTTIKFSVTQEADISLNVYTITGELVTQLINSAHFSQGSYKVTFDASKLASGTYIYTLKNGSQLLSKKMTLLK